jgi:hypothetical protein
MEISGPLSGIAIHRETNRRKLELGAVSRKGWGRAGLSLLDVVKDLTRLGKTVGMMDLLNLPAKNLTAIW